MTSRFILPVVASTSSLTLSSAKWSRRSSNAVGWIYAPDQVKDDLAEQPQPFHSKLFPTWKAMSPRALRGIDAAVTRFAAFKPATAAALKKAILDELA